MPIYRFFPIEALPSFSGFHDGFAVRVEGATASRYRQKADQDCSPKHSVSPVGLQAVSHSDPSVLATKPYLNRGLPPTALMRLGTTPIWKLVKFSIYRFRTAGTRT